MAYFPPDYLKEQMKQNTVRGGQADINQSMKDRVNKATGGGKKQTKPKPPVAKKTGGIRGALKKAGPYGAAGLVAYETAEDVLGDEYTAGEIPQRIGENVAGLIPGGSTAMGAAKGGFTKGVRAFQEDQGGIFSNIDAGINAYLGGASEVLNTQAKPEFRDTPDTTFPEAPEGAEVQPSTIPSVRQSQADVARTDFNEPDIDYDFDVPGEVTGTVRDSQGRTGTITGPEEALSSERGTMSTYSGSDALQDSQAKDLARRAASGEISTQQYNAGLRSIRQAQESGQGRGGDNASRLADSISRIEGELSRPGRGANQSLNDMLTEARVRKNKRKALDELYGLQKQEQATSSVEGVATANRESREAIAEQKAIATANKEARAESVRSEQETQRRKEDVRDYNLKVAEKQLAQIDTTQKQKTQAMEKATATYKEDAKAQYPDDPDRQNMHTAKMQMSHVKPGDNFFTTSAGRLARRQAAEQLIKHVRSERGVVDWAASWPSDAPTQADLENMDFSQWEFGDAGEGAYAFRPTVRSKQTGKEANYAYLHSMPDDLKYVLQRLIENDKSGNQGVRRGQK